MKSGIYALVNDETGKVYVGRSIDLDKRKRTHFWALRNGQHPNSHLQRAWNGGARFSFQILEECSPDVCNEREVFWIERLDALRHGYNQCEGGQATTGYHFTEEQKNHISEALKGTRRSRDAVERGKETLRRHLEEDPVFAAEYRRKLSEGSKGRPSWNKGRPCPEWKKAQVSEKLKGRKISEEHKDKLRRLYSGEKSLSAKLTREDVINIRYRFLSGERQIDIVKDYPVTAQTIYDIVRGRRWKSVPNTLAELEVLL